MLKSRCYGCLCLHKTIIFCFGSFFFKMPSLEFIERNLTKICQFRSEPDLKMHVQI